MNQIEEVGYALAREPTWNHATTVERAGIFSRERV
jgi:hypothetical protein